MKNSNQIQNNESGPRQLPIKEMNGKSYYVDERLQQYRNVHNPHDIINFNGDHVLVYTYSRAQAIEDGQLIDISELAKEAGFKFPVAVSCGVSAILSDTEQPGQSFEGRAWDLLTVLRYAIRNVKKTDVVDFEPLFNSKLHGQPKPYRMYAKCHGGDNCEPVITVMLPHED